MALSILSNFAAGSIGLAYGFSNFLLQIGLQGYPQLFEDKPISDEAKKYAGFLKDEGIRNDFLIIEGTTPWIRVSLGSNWPKINKAAIIILEGLKEVDEDAYDFLLITAFKRIKNHNDLLQDLAMIVANVAVYAFSYYMTSNEWVACLISLVSGYWLREYEVYCVNNETKSMILDKNITLCQLDGRLRILKCWHSLNKSIGSTLKFEMMMIKNEMKKRIAEFPKSACSLLSVEEQKRRERMIKKLMFKAISKSSFHKIFNNL